jgi:disulfide bond formation protein DsbB
MVLSFRSAVGLALLGSAAVIAGALLFQYVGGLAPCELCLYERWPYYAAMPLAAVLLPLARRRKAAVGGGLLLAAVFAGSAALGFYHVGVEQHWFAGPAACTGAGKTANTIEQLRAQLLHQQPVQCDQPQWALFGVTLAGWNLLASMALALVALEAVRAAAAEGRTA